MTTLTDRTDQTNFSFLPAFQEVLTEQKHDHYKINGKRYQRVTTINNIINKPLILPAAVRTAHEVAAEIFKTNLVRQEFAQILRNSPNPLALRKNYNDLVDSTMTQVRLNTDSKRSEAVQAGTKVHAEINEAWRQDQTPNLNHYSSQTINAFNFLQQEKIQVLALETIIWSDEWQIADTCDAIGRYESGELVLWNWKTGTGPWPEMALQLAAYAKMVELLTGEPVAEYFIVKLNPFTATKHRVYYPEEALNMFETAMKLQRGMRTKFFEDPDLEKKPRNAKKAA